MLLIVIQEEIIHSVSKELSSNQKKELIFDLEDSGFQVFKLNISIYYLWNQLINRIIVIVVIPTTEVVVFSFFLLYFLLFFSPEVLFGQF